MKKSENQPPNHSGITSREGNPPELRIVVQPQTKEEAEELVFSMTKHAMRDPHYDRESNGLLAMTIDFAREDQALIEEEKRAIHQGLGPVQARMKRALDGREEPK